MNVRALETDLQTWVLLWLALAALMLARHVRAGRHVGLLLTYAVSMGALHWFAPALYLLPWGGNWGLSTTLEGLRQSTFAMAGLALGAEVVRHVGPRSEWRADRALASRTTVVPRLINLYLISGTILYAILFSAAGRLPTVRALISTGSTLMVVGISLKCWNAWQSGRRGAMWLWLAAAGAFPILTVVTQGYLGYGFAATAMVFAFFVSFYRPQWKAMLLAIVLAYGGMSVYVTYMRDRGQIRDVVWGGASTSERVEQLTVTVRSFEWFDWRQFDHIERVSVRLNQNYLVGAAVWYLRRGHADFARGATFWEAALAVVPRAIWPDKPLAAGSGDVVSRYTGLRFGENTSVGVGQVLECYINFGSTGVFLGFLVIGGLLVLADRSAAIHLNRGDSGRFLLWYLPGLTLLQVGGSLTEVTAMAGASYVVAWIFVHAAAAAGPQPDAARADAPSQAEATS
jgi:hypothetical protein